MRVKAWYRLTSQRDLPQGVISQTGKRKCWDQLMSPCCFVRTIPPTQLNRAYWRQGQIVLRRTGYSAHRRDRTVAVKSGMSRSTLTCRGSNDSYWNIELFDSSSWTPSATTSATQAW